MQSDFNREADELIVAGRYLEAGTVLEQAIEAMPKDWTPRRDDGKFITIAFWDQKEFWRTATAIPRALQNQLHG
jgi:hypothetical protein